MKMMKIERPKSGQKASQSENYKILRSKSGQMTSLSMKMMKIERPKSGYMTTLSVQMVKLRDIVTTVLGGK